MDWDKKLRISTGGTDENSIDAHHNRYEPTPYAVLSRLANSGHVGQGNTLVDYGCGKGRVSLFLHHRLGCRTVGVEYDPDLYRQALENRSLCGAAGAEFVCVDAQRYAATTEDRFYFFNPFSAAVFSSVLRQIQNSLYETPRPVKLIFYYPDDSWLQVLAAEDLRLLEEVDCRDLFAGNDPKERLLIYGLEV